MTEQFSLQNTKMNEQKERKKMSNTIEYSVTITEILQKTVTVEAATEEEAKKKVHKAWTDCEYILDADNFVGVEFLATKCEPVRHRAEREER